MSCKCCDRFLKSSSIEVTRNKLLVTIESDINPINLHQYCLLLAQKLPNGSNTLPVEIVINGNTYPMYSRSGNVLRADQLRCRRVYPIVHGNDPDHFSLLSYVPQTVYTSCGTSKEV